MSYNRLREGRAVSPATLSRIPILSWQQKKILYVFKSSSMMQTLTPELAIVDDGVTAPDSYLSSLVITSVPMISIVTDFCYSCVLFLLLDPPLFADERVLKHTYQSVNLPQFFVSFSGFFFQVEFFKKMSIERKSF